MQIALQVPGIFGESHLRLDHLLPETLSRCSTLGVTALELSASSIEDYLGKPSVSARFAEAVEMPDDPFEAGLLELEYECLRDEMVAARQAAAEIVCEWRLRTSLTTLDALRQQAADLGVRIAIVRWTGLASFSDPEIDWCFSAAKAVGAGTIVTPFVVGDPRRLAPFADRHAMTVAFHGDRATRRADLEAALRHSPLNAVSVDLRAWGSAWQGSPLPFLRQHRGRVVQVQIDAADVGDGPMAEVIGDVLLEGCANDWKLQVTIGLEAPDLDEPERSARIERALAYCLNGLRLKT